MNTTAATVNARAQQAAQDAIDQLVSSGQETGMQVTAYLDGARVVDAWAGLADPQSGRPMDGDTLINVWSAGKGVAGAVVAALVEQGTLAYEDPVTRYWPEYGAHGKAGTTIADVMTHSAGVPQLPPDITPARFSDVPAMAAWLAQQTPIWEPGARSGYHAATFGYLVDEIVRRATGRTLDEVTRDLVTGPLGVADALAFAVPEARQPALAVLVDDGDSEAALAAIPPESPVYAMRAVLPTARIGNRPDLLAASFPAGVEATARALARLYAALACGGEIDGARILSRESVARLIAPEVEGVDAVMNVPMRRSLGFNLGEDPPSVMGGPAGFGYPGAGGSFAYGESDSRYAIAVTKNRMTQNWPLVVDAAIRAALGLPVAQGAGG